MNIVILRCLPIDFAVYETFPFHSVSVESYEFNGDQFVAFAQPDSGFCTLYVWDHVEMVFRSFHNITCKLPAMKASILYHSMLKKMYPGSSASVYLSCSSFCRVLQTSGDKQQSLHGCGATFWWISYLQVRLEIESSKQLQKLVEFPQRIKKHDLKGTA